ncbi:MAG: hypothetical protein ABL967_19050 [Bryobacteraceae bacterium]
MIADVLIALGATGAVMTLLDLMLSENQKRAVSNATLRIWGFVDGLKSLRLSDWFHNKNARVWFSTTVALFTFLVFMMPLLDVVSSVLNVFSGREENNSHFVFWFTSAFALFSGILAYYLSGVNFQTITKNIKRSAIGTVYGIVMGIGLGGLLSYFEPSAWQSFSIFIMGQSTIQSSLTAGLALLLISIFGMVGFIFFWGTILFFVAVALAHVVAAGFSGAEFVVRRVAEYPKGPVLALSALCGGLAAFIKSFG